MFFIQVSLFYFSILFKSLIYQRALKYRTNLRCKSLVTENQVTGMDLLVGHPVDGVGSVGNN